MNKSKLSAFLTSASLYKIISKQGDYVISLKGNQGTLHDDVKLFLETEKKADFVNTKHDYYETVEKGHGRVETRRYWITEQINWLDNKNEWRGLKTIGLVDSERYVKGEASFEQRFLSALSLQMPDNLLPLSGNIRLSKITYTGI